MAFEWDAAKNAANIAQPGIDFEDASRIFDAPVLEKTDARRDYGEDRIIAFGVIDERELAVVYARRGDHCRIISARRAHGRERKASRETYPKQPPAR